MQRFLFRLLITAVAVMLAGVVLPNNLVKVDDFGSALIFAVVLGILNAFVRPILLLLTFPLTLLTLGLFTFVVNALVFWLATLLPVGVRGRSIKAPERQPGADNTGQREDGRADEPRDELQRHRAGDGGKFGGAVNVDEDVADS